MSRSEKIREESRTLTIFCQGRRVSQMVCRAAISYQYKTQEIQEQDAIPCRDFYTVSKVDNHIH